MLKKTKNAPSDPPSLIVGSSAAVARWFDCHSRTVEGWAARGCPGMQPRRYDVREICRWLYREWQRRNPRVAKAGDTTEDELMLAAGSSPALERYREARARIAELQADEAEGSYLHAEKMQACLQRMAAILREAGDKLQKRFGPDAKSVLDEHLDAFEALIPELFGDK